MLAADGSLLERGSLPETPARHCGARPAKHHGAALQLRLEAEERQPGGLELKTLRQTNARVISQVLCICAERRRTGDHCVKFELSSLFSCSIYIIYEGLIWTEGFHTHFIVCALCICIQTLQEAIVVLIATWS